jgi:hypothetical protein
MKSYFYIPLLSAAFIISAQNACSQADSISAEQKIIPESTSEKASDHSLYAGLGYGNNMVLASTVTTTQPYFYGSMIYGFKNKFYASASTFHLPSFDPFLAYSAFGLNYTHTFNSWFDISAGVYRYQISEQLSDTLFSSFFYGDFTLGVDWRLIYSRISFGAILSESSKGYLQIKNSRYFQTPEFFKGKAYISFDPYFNILMGSLTKTIVDGETVIGIDSPMRGGSGSGSGAGAGGGSGPGSSSTSQTTTFFGLMEMDFGLPVGFNIGRLTLEAEPGYVIPMYTDPAIATPEGFTIMLNCLIKIF